MIIRKESLAMKKPKIKELTNEGQSSSAHTNSPSNLSGQSKFSSSPLMR